MHTPNLEALLSEQEASGPLKIFNPKSLTREELTVLIHSAPEEPLVNDPTSSVLEAVTFPSDDPDNYVKDLLQNVLLS